MSDISVNDVYFRYDQDREVLSGLSFQVDAGEKTAVLGSNGCGKTTLMRMLTGALTPDRGSVTLAKGRRVGYVAQMNDFVSDKTAEEVLRGAYSDVLEAEKQLNEMRGHMESVSSSRYAETLARFESRNGYGWEAEMNRVANGLGITRAMRDTRFGALSGGEQTRVHLARLIMEEPDILLLDEPTNHLDTEALEWLEEYLSRFKGTVLVISHDRYFLDAAVTRVIEIKNGKAEFYSGNYSFYAKEKELRYQQQLQRYEREQAKISQLEFQITRLKAWGNVYDNPALHKKAAAMEKRVERIRQTDKPVRESRLQAAFAGETIRADRVIELCSLSAGYGEQPLFENAGALIRGTGERVAVIGRNGCGKTTLLKVLTGELAPLSGQVITGPAVKTAVLPQQITFEHPERTLYDTLLYETACTPQEARDRLGTFRFTGEDQFKRVEQLSGGEKTRLKLCILMLRRANLLILDEPTNHLDLASREWIEEAVAGFQGTLLFVSHDRYFIRRFANRIWEIGDGVLTDYHQDWDGYRRVKALNALREKQEKAKEPKKAAPAAAKEPSARGKDPKTQRRLAFLEREIEKQEGQLADFDARMAAYASDYGELMRITKEKEAFQKQIDALYAEWEALSGTV